jgi:hypothetical protein
MARLARPKCNDRPSFSRGYEAPARQKSPGRARPAKTFSGPDGALHGTGHPEPLLGPRISGKSWLRGPSVPGRVRRASAAFLSTARAQIARQGVADDPSGASQPSVRDTFLPLTRLPLDFSHFLSRQASVRPFYFSHWLEEPRLLWAQLP